MRKRLPRKKWRVAYNASRPKNYMKNNKSQIIIYKAEDGQTKIEVRFDGDTVWLTQSVLAELSDDQAKYQSAH